MNIKDVLGKISGIIGKLPFVKLAEKIPEGARTKLPFLNALIPLANHIASGAAIVVLISCLGGGGGMSGSEWTNPNGDVGFKFSGNTVRVLFKGEVLEGITYTLEDDILTLDFPDMSSEDGVVVFDNVSRVPIIDNAFSGNVRYYPPKSAGLNHMMYEFSGVYHRR